MVPDESAVARHREAFAIVARLLDETMADPARLWALVLAAGQGMHLAGALSTAYVAQGATLDEVFSPWLTHDRL